MKGTRQGSLLSPSLFNLYTETILREVEDMNGVIVGEDNINNLRYDNDTALLTMKEYDLQDLVTAVNYKGKTYWMEMNATKTKTMVFIK